MPTLTAPLTHVKAPSAWQRIDFISDLHLDASERATFDAWAHYMAHTPAHAVFILGDLFEVWIGDDTQDPFALQCIDVLKQATSRLPVYFMCGNRDFLAGDALMRASGMQALADPCVLKWPADNNTPAHRLLLSHGDALCLGDHEYLTFRAQVRQTSWQQTFLARPMAERQAYARSIRSQSEARKLIHSDAPGFVAYADVDKPATEAWLKAAQAQVLIHGHTHKPAVHGLGQGLQRWVLSDWDATATPPRLEVLSWLAENANDANHGLHRLALRVD